MDRRSLLRGLGLGAGYTLFAPLLTDYLREARGQGPAAKRMAMLFGAYSFAGKYLNPVVRSPTDFDLNPITAPLQPHKADLLMIRNLGVPNLPGANGGHGQDTGVYLGLGPLFGWNGQGWQTQVGQEGTIDRFIARKIGVNDRVSSITFRGTPRLPIDYTSWDGNGKPYPGFASAVDAYDKIFVGAVPSAGGQTGGAAPSAQALLAREKSLLDFVAGEVKTLQTRLAGTEREKLDRFTESLRGVERKLVTVASAPAPTCATPTRPAAAADRNANIEAQVDVAAMALACGLSHVAALSIGPGNHDENHADDPSVGTTNTWRLQMTVRLFSKLKQLGFGDSSLVMYSDPNGQVHHGGVNQGFFYVLLGGLGGAIKTGRVLELAGRPYMGDFYAGIATAMGAPTSTFGDAALCKGPLSALKG